MKEIWKSFASRFIWSLIVCAALVGCSNDEKGAVDGDEFYVLFKGNYESDSCIIPYTVHDGDQIVINSTIPTFGVYLGQDAYRPEYLRPLPDMSEEKLDSYVSYLAGERSVYGVLNKDSVTIYTKDSPEELKYKWLTVRQESPTKYVFTVNCADKTEPKRIYFGASTEEDWLFNMSDILVFKLEAK